QRAFEVNLIDTRQLESIWGEFGTHDVSFEDYKSMVLRKEYMTNYQVDRILSGERSGFYYGDFKVLYMIGAGSFARVYRAVHRGTGRIVAIKALRKRYREDVHQTEQFLREGKMGATLRHPNIVPIYEVHADRRQPFLVMEFVEGRSLREFVKIRKKLEPIEALKLIKDITSGLAYAAEKGITHRDLKMSNILVTSKAQAKLVDFGLAAANANMPDDDTDSPNARAIDYAALERHTGVKRDDPRSDIYFVGCIFYNMLTGIPPLYETRDRLMRLSVQRFHDVKPIADLEPTLPRLVAMVVNKAMEFQPDRRYRSQREMLADMEAVYQRLLNGDNGNDVAIEPGAPIAKSPTLEGLSRTIMFIEANAGMQDLLREKLKQHGYRVLIVSDPDRGMARFTGQQHVADCVIFSALDLGPAAVDAFNRFGADDVTRDMPAILLLDQKQQRLAAEAQLAPHRVLVSMPLKVKELRQTLVKLLQGVPSGAPQNAS
ncbi:MAG TPA: serine/threonine-protein kinase, partial [Pirellulaceae bacterium]|nr:serine/threonine-protein kinase [Pirellulaceae bacterium]